MVWIILKYHNGYLGSCGISQACIYPKYPTKTMLFFVYTTKNITMENCDFFCKLEIFQIWLKYHWNTTLLMIGYTSKCGNNFNFRLAYYKVFSVQQDISQVSAANEWDIELNTRREIPITMPATMSYFVCHINILLTRRSHLNPWFKKRMHCHSFMALNRASDTSAAAWLSQTQMKNYRFIFHVVIQFFSVVEIPIKHSSLRDKVL